MGQYVEKLIPKSIKFLKLERKIPLHNNGTPVRNWLHADDTAEAIITIINSNVKNEIYNICGGFEQTNLETVSKIIKLYDPQSISPSSEYLDLSYNRDGQDLRYALNDNKLRNLGWVPEKIFDKELPEIIKYYKRKFIW